jgi:hypothetical protein
LKLLVNLQKHQVIDVLADRKAETTATWMASHPEIELVSRDRGVRLCCCGFGSRSSDPRPRPPVLDREAMFLFLHRPDELSAEEQETLTQRRSLHAQVDQAYELVQQFREMLRTRTGE